MVEETPAGVCTQHPSIITDPSLKTCPLPSSLTRLGLHAVAMIHGMSVAGAPDSLCCLLLQGSYSLPKSDFSVPELELPYWLTNGHYRAEGVLGKQGSELGCLKVALSLRSG
uniref:Uncharacterized protein n=1 Tax=Knipowitschia caucasica TaxID=637954 RepID=A0AAV2KDP0_KNICA